MFLTFWKVKSGKGFSTVDDPKSNSKSRTNNRKAKQCKQKQKKRQQQQPHKQQQDVQTAAQYQTAATQQHKQHNKQQKTFWKVKSGQILVFQRSATRKHPQQQQSSKSSKDRSKTRSSSKATPWIDSRRPKSSNKKATTQQNQVQHKQHKCPEEWVSRRVVSPKFRSFSRLLPLFSLSPPSLEGPFVEFWWCLKRRDPEMCTLRVLGLSCEATFWAVRRRVSSGGSGERPNFGRTNENFEHTPHRHTTPHHNTTQHNTTQHNTTHRVVLGKGNAVDFGHYRLRPILNVEFLDHKLGGGERGGEGWGPEGWGGAKGGEAKISRFFPLSCHCFHCFLPLLEGPFVEFWWCLKRRDPEMRTLRVLGKSKQNVAQTRKVKKNKFKKSEKCFAFSSSFFFFSLNFFLSIFVFFLQIFVMFGVFSQPKLLFSEEKVFVSRRKHFASQKSFLYNPSKISSCGIFVTDNKIPSHLESNSLNIVISKNNGEQVSVVLDRIMGSSDPEVIVDQVSNLSTAKETVLLLSLLFLQTDSSF